MMSLTGAFLPDVTLQATTARGKAITIQLEQARSTERSEINPGGRRPAVEKIDTVIIGGGQAGLAMSYLLSQQGREHVVLEKGQRAGESWRRRWDSFTLVTPNWQLRLPGHVYTGDEPDGFLARDEVVAYLEAYVALFAPPLRFGVQVTAVEPAAGGSGYLVRTPAYSIEATNVVVATGTFHRPRLPAASSLIAEEIVQLHSSDYRNPGALPEGAVLVAGSGQSGCQIAQELKESGREVYLATGRAGRLPRRYRGRDGMWWAQQLGMYDIPAEKLQTREERFEAHPQLMGRKGGQELSLHHLARDGVRLLGRLEEADGYRLRLAPDLHENLARGDGMVARFREAVDQLVAEQGMDAPVEEAAGLQHGYDQEVVTELDLQAASIGAIIWATGYRWDYSWARLPVFDDAGYPVQQRGVTAYPGLYFLGQHYLHTRKSGLFYGVGEDAAHIAAQIAERSHAG
jgi:putative flavoprotein involved in K+ transport